MMSKEEKSAYQRAYRATHKEETAAHKKLWRENNPDKVKASRNAYYVKNKDKQIAYSKLWRENNPEKAHIISKKSEAKLRKKSETDIATFVGRIFTAMKNRARKKKQKVGVDREYMIKLLEETNGICVLSGLQLSTIIYDPMRASPDRIDSNKGYVKGNIQWVGACLNIAKRDHTLEQFIAMCKAVVEHNSP
jgi:hypothetical protein